MKSSYRIHIILSNQSVDDKSRITNEYEERTTKQTQ